MLTMNSLFDRYERECVPKLSPRTQKDYKAILRRLRASFGDMDPLAVKPRDVGRALKRGVIKERFTFHDLRAKCVSDNKSIEAAMQLAGHTNMSMTRRVYDRGIREVDPLE